MSRLAFIIVLIFITTGCNRSGFTILVTAEKPTTFEKLSSSDPLIEIIHDSNVIVPARIDKVVKGESPYKVGTKIYLLVDDPKQRFGSNDTNGKHYEIFLQEDDIGIWDYRIKDK